MKKPKKQPQPNLSPEEIRERWYLRRLRETEDVEFLASNPMLAFDIAHDDGLSDQHFDELLAAFKEPLDA